MQWLTWDDSREGTPPEVQVIESDAESTTFEIIIHGFFLEVVEKETSLGTIAFSRIFLPRDANVNYGATPYVGQAELPVIRRYIAVLSDAEDALIASDAYEIEESAVSTVEGVTVYPLQRPSSEQYPPAQFDLKEKFYTSSMPFPLDYAEPRVLTFDVEEFHRLRVAKVEMFPFVCVPSEQRLYIYRHFKVKVEHSAETIAAPVPPTILDEEMYGDLVANYEAIRPFLPPTLPVRQAYYLILVPQRFLTEILPLVWWKRAKGLEVSVMTLPGQIPNTPETIEGAIEAFYDSHPIGDVFVLLVGDVQDVASPTCSAYEWNELTEETSSDIQYARVAGDDAIPDLFLGRIPADNEQDVENIVAKTLQYERLRGETDAAWLGKVLLVGHKQDYPGSYTACNESIRSYRYLFATPSFDTAYGGGGATNLDIRRAFNEGKGIIAYRGYGGADCWWTWGVAGQSWCINPDVANLANDGKTPVVFSVASLDTSIRTEDCLGEELVELPQRGAVAYYGAAADAGSAPNEHLDRNLFKAVFDEEIHFLGAVVNWAQIRTMEEFSGEGFFSAAYNANLYTLLGDPEMSMRTRRPLVFGTVDYPPWVEPGEQNVEVVAKNPNGGPIRKALVTVRKYKGVSASPDVAVSGYTDDEGTARFAIAPATRGALSVNVLKQDYIPFDSDYPLRVIHAERDPSVGAFSFSWQGDPQKTYAVEISDRMGFQAEWRLLGISPERDGLTLTVTDPAAASEPSRFYRVVAQ
ncbi:MAG: C25 family cysteine peptidase [bacterium]|nr:C25 family cysteine peptidase [bacterium]